MAHGAVFGQYDRQETQHGDAQFGVVDWEMFMAARPVGAGIFTARVMTSLEALALGRRGYPELLQSGASDAGARLANRQHPHDLWNELAATYDHALSSSIAAFAYGAAVGEPALGPVAYMHRPSADADPFAPLGHHWQDAAHESFGVITAGVYGARAKVEGSVFNGREPDAYRFNLDYRGAHLDSYAARLTVAPSSRVTASAWGGYVFDHDPLDPGTGMQRYGASLLTVLPVRFLYPNLAPRPWRGPVLAGAIVWLGAMLWLLRDYPGAPAALVWASLLYPAFYVGLSLRLGRPPQAAH